jgi:ABC-type polysaccharide/polyol phosphate transport system ATPase subunit
VRPAVVVRDLTKKFRVPIDRSTTLKYRIAHFKSASRYRDLMALRNVSFDLGEGEFLGVIGANGSGKSTLLKILARIYRPTSGEVQWTGSVSPFLELGVGFNPELTARENVFVNGAILGISHRELAKRMDGILGFAELTEFGDQKLKNYSSGMQMRLAFTVAIQAEAASILLMDEVLAVGDARFQAKCFDVFTQYRRAGKTVVLVTHDLAAVDFHCDRALLLDHGELVMDGRAADVTALYKGTFGQSLDSVRAAASMWPRHAQASEDVDVDAGAIARRS